MKPQTDLVSHFNSEFAHFGISLPADAVKRKRGKIVARGWAIWYLFGSNVEGDYLDYYASNRMTDDRHFRIFSDGRCETLPTISSFEHFTDNQEVARMLEEKGFGIEGDEPGGIILNRLLRLNELDDED
jgi:hypothetical protein